MRQNVKVAISLPSDILSDTDKLASQRGKSRSAIIRDALARVLIEEVDKATEVKAKTLYKEIGEEDKILAEKFRGIIKKNLPPYSINKKE